MDVVRLPDRDRHLQALVSPVAIAAVADILTTCFPSLGRKGRDQARALQAMAGGWETENLADG